MFNCRFYNLSNCPRINIEMLRKSLFVSFLLLVSINIYGQDQKIASVYHDVHKLNSAILNEERSFWVRVPLNYELTSQKYPVVYMLDGHAPQPSMMAGIIEQQAWGGKIPEMILVSIQNTDRSRDLTPTDDGKGGRVGGGDKFLSFIEKEVMPIVEKNYRTQPFKIFAGHSLGGLTVVYSLASRPNLFDAYIAASPVLHYDDYFVIKETEKLFTQSRQLNKTIFLGLGDEPEYKSGWDRFQKLLKDKKPKNFDSGFQMFPDDNHGSVVLLAYHAGLRKVFEGWEAPNKTGTIAELENHYEKLSKRFGYEIFIPEDILNRAAYQLIEQKLFGEALRLFKQNAENYPYSPNVFDSLGDGYEANGKLKEAIESFEKAYKMATKIGDPVVAKTAKANFDRTSAKLKPR